MGAEVFHTLKKALKDAGHNTNVGDEGGFAPNLPSAEAALDFVMKSIEQAGYKPGRDIVIGLDCAATEFFKNGAYVYEGEGKTRSIRRSRPNTSPSWSAAYPIASIEDGMAEDDWDGWKALTDLRRRQVPARRRRPLRHQRDAAVGRASARASPIPSWSR